MSTSPSLYARSRRLLADALAGAFGRRRAEGEVWRVEEHLPMDGDAARQRDIASRRTTEEPCADRQAPDRRCG